MKTKINVINYNLGAYIEELIDYLGDGVDFTDNSDSYRGPAICHGGDNPTGLSLYKEPFVWSCWTRSCQEEHGCDLIGLISCCKEISRKEAVILANKFLKNKDSIEFVPEPKSTKKEDYLEEHLNQKKLNKDTVKNLSADLSYLVKRGFDERTLKRLGCGLARFGVMKDRVVFPIRDINSELIGFSGRTVNDNFYKWRNTSYKKSLNALNIDLCKKFINKKNLNKIIITEGALDVARLCEAGYWNCVSILGSSIKQSQVEILKSIGMTNVVLIMDNDQAGRDSEQKNVSKLTRGLFNVEVIYPTKDDVGDMSVKEVRSMLGDIKWKT